MAYNKISTRTSSDPNASADINQLQDNFDSFLNTNGSATEFNFVDVASTTGLHTESGTLKWKTDTVSTSSGGGGGGSDGVAFFLRGNQYVGDAQIMINIPKIATVTKVVARVITAPTDADLELNVQHNGANDILTSDLSIADGADTGTSTSISSTYASFSENDFVTVDVNQVGSTVVGANLMIALVF